MRSNRTVLSARYVWQALVRRVQWLILPINKGSMSSVEWQRKLDCKVRRDLWEAKNMTAVLIGLYGLGVVCHKKKIAGSKGGIVGKGKSMNRGGSLYGDMDYVG
eukprot:167179_1